MHRYAAGLKDGADLDGELLPAVSAETESASSTFALYAGNPIRCTAMRTDRAVGPNNALDFLVSRVLVVEIYLAKYAHGLVLVRSTTCNISTWLAFAKYIIAIRRGRAVGGPIGRYGRRNIRRAVAGLVCAAQGGWVPGTPPAAVELAGLPRTPQAERSSLSRGV